MLQTKHVGVTLQNMQRGERAWFWFCQNVDEVDIPLVVMPLSKDPSAFTLGEIVANFALPADAVQCVGIAHCDEDGRMHLGSSSAQATTLPALARWVKARQTEAPGLARLANARVLSYDDDRVITGIWEDAALWKGVSAPAASGGLKDAAAVLRSLQPGQGAWFWACPRGPGGIPFILLVPDTVSAADFAKKVAGVKARTERGADSAVGLLQVLQTGRVVLTTEDDIQLCRSVVAALSANPAFARFKDGMVLAKSAGGYAAGGALKAADHTQTAALIEGLTEGARLFFWLTPAGPGGTVLLEVTETQDAIKAAVKDHTAPVAFGSLTLTDGAVVFKARRSFPGAEAALAGFVKLYQRAWPSLRRLKKSRIEQGSR